MSGVPFPGPRVGISAPPPELSGAKMFPRPLGIALLSDYPFSWLQNSILGAIQAPTWPSLDSKNSEFAREGCKKNQFPLFPH